MRQVLQYLIILMCAQVYGQDIRIDSIVRNFKTNSGATKTTEYYSYSNQRDYFIQRKHYNPINTLLSEGKLVYEDSLLVEIIQQYRGLPQEMETYIYDEKRRLIESIELQGKDTTSWYKWTHQTTDTSSFIKRHILRDWSCEQTTINRLTLRNKKGNYKYTDDSRVDMVGDTLERERTWEWLNGDTLEHRMLISYSQQALFSDHYKRFPEQTVVDNDTTFTEWHFLHYDEQGFVTSEYKTASITWNNNRGNEGEMTYDTQGYYRIHYQETIDFGDSTSIDFYEGVDSTLTGHSSWSEDLRRTSIVHDRTYVEFYDEYDQVVKIHLYSVDLHNGECDTVVNFYYSLLNSTKNLAPVLSSKTIRELDHKKHYFNLEGKKVDKAPARSCWLIEVNEKDTRRVFFIK